MPSQIAAWSLRGGGQVLPAGTWFRGLRFAGKNASGREQPRYHLFKEGVAAGEKGYLQLRAQCGATAKFDTLGYGPWVSDTRPKTKSSVCAKCVALEEKQKETAQ